MTSFIENLSVKNKIIGNSVLLILLMIIASSYAIRSMESIGIELKAISQQDIPMTHSLTIITELQLKQAIHFERAVRFGELKAKGEDSNNHFDKEIKAFDDLNSKINKELEQSITRSKAIKDKAHTSEEKKEFEHVTQALESISK